MPIQHRAAEVEVLAPARLHLGFLDLNGDLGRRFGGIGLAIEEIGFRLSLTSATAAGASGPGADRALRYLTEAAAALEVPDAAHLTIREAIPGHAGLGSGTQLGLAVAAALARLHGRELGTAALARAAGRGARSGIGIGAFASGGFLVDGGRDGGDAPAPIIARLPFPSAWRVLLIFDGGRSGLNGAAEAQAFTRLAPFDEGLAGRLSRLVLMRLLPAIAEAEFAPAAEAIGEIQDRLGDYFAGAQNGRYSSPAVGRALAWLRAQNVTGIGQTSWGPTGFALTDSAAEAQRLAASLREHSTEWRELEFRVVAGRNRGAEITPPRREGAFEHE
jgi:beta-RFAP synthase